jgi:hypothetical protein
LKCPHYFLFFFTMIFGMYLVGTIVGRFSLFQWEPLWFSVWFSEWELKVFRLGDNLLENLLFDSCSSENRFFEILKGYQLNLCVITFKDIKTYEHQFSGFSMCLVIEHLKAQGRLDPRGGLVISDVQTKLEPLLLMHLTR